MTAVLIKSPDELMHQASVTASKYMRQAIASIDEQFGNGYAKAHPELVAAFVQAASRDFLAAVLHDHVVSALYAVADHLPGQMEVSNK